MTNDFPTATVQAGATCLDASTVARVLAHPLRVRILKLMVGQDCEPTMSAKNLADTIGQRLNITAYHVRKLVDAGALTLVDERPRNNAIESFYALTGDGESLARLPQPTDREPFDPGSA